MAGPNDVRQTIQAQLGGVTATSCITILGNQYDLLKSMDRSIEVVDDAGLIDALAEDLVRQDKFPSIEAAMPTAKSQITINKTTALTTSNDFYIALKGGDPFDELHELIHICSAPGGLSNLQKTCNSLNEGAINVFSEEVAKVKGVKVIPRYPNETLFARDLQKLLDTGLGAGSGLKYLFPLTFKTGGDTKVFFEAIGKAYKAMLAKKKEDKAKKLNFVQNGLLEKTDAVVGADFQPKVLDYGAAWLKNMIAAAQ